MTNLPTRADTVVIGAGTSGCVAAAHLIDRTDASVVLLEAGPDYGPFDTCQWPSDLLDASAVPASHDWGYSGPGADGRQLRFERARVAGGCSSHNGCSQTWGWAGDYDSWSRHGLTGWSAADMTPLYAEASHRLRIRRYLDREVQPFHAAFLESCESRRIARSADLDDLEGGSGCDVSPVNIVDGIRWNTAFAYLDPCRANQRLTVADNCEVVRIVIRSNRVTGVWVRCRGGSLEMIACEQVILAAGAYGTPEVLLRSGVGPADDLRRLDIPVVADLPGVGGNLHDQPTVSLTYDASPQLVTELLAFRTAEQWLPEEQAIAKVASSVADGPFDLHLYPWVEPSADSPTGWAVVLPAGLLTPRARGRLALRTRDSGVRAQVDHRYLGHDDDVTALSDGLDVLFDLARSGPLQTKLGRPRSRPGRGADRSVWIRRNHTHYWHPGGTAAMGVDGASVTGPDGAVHGIGGLTVVDASVFPKLPRATTALPVVVGAEKIMRAAFAG